MQCTENGKSLRAPASLVVLNRTAVVLIAVVVSIVHMKDPPVRSAVQLQVGGIEKIPAAILIVTSPTPFLVTPESQDPDCEVIDAEPELATRTLSILSLFEPLVI